MTGWTAKGKGLSGRRRTRRGNGVRRRTAFCSKAPPRDGGAGVFSLDGAAARWPEGVSKRAAGRADGDGPEDVDTRAEPDITVVWGPSKLDDIGREEAPDFVAEVLSPSGKRHDRLVKFELCRWAGVRNTGSRTRS